jgi:ABC-type oligopeptide transport system substrate-binding subunit
MKRQFFSAVAVVLMVLPGCASNSGSRYASEKKYVVDQAYVNAVNYASRQSGVRVTWVNPPTKRVPVDGDASN